MYEELQKLCLNGLTINEIGDKLGKSKPTIIKYLKKYNLQTKYKRGQVKNQHLAYGNKFRRMSCWDLNFPLRITRLWIEYPERNKCELCNSQKNLRVHHKDENRKNNKKENIMVVCHRCHLHTIHQCYKYFPKDRGWSKRRQ